MSKCQYCGADNARKKLFCAPACRDAFYNLMAKRGRVAMPLLLAWRAGRGSGASPKKAFAELCAYADHCNAEDRAAGRPPMASLIEYRGQHGEVTNWRERDDAAKRRARELAD